MSIFRQSLESVPSRQYRLSFNIKNVDSLFPYFGLNDFAVLSGSSSSVRSLVDLMCVRAQLPFQLGGLESTVLFVDGGNSFRLYRVSEMAQKFELDPKQVLERIFISRAFTAYQTTDLILERLEGAVKKYDTKLVIVANIAHHFMDKDIEKEEAHEIFLHVTRHLADYVKKNQVILLVSHHMNSLSRRQKFFQHVLTARGNIAISIKPINKRPNFVLEKHPIFVHGRAEFPVNHVTLEDFMNPLA